MKYGFIGFGNLAKAIYQGLKNEDNISFAYISKSNRNKEIQSFKTLQELVYFSDVILLCIKPQDLTQVLTGLKKIPFKNKIIVSPVAGKSIGFIEKKLGKKETIVRIMPNLAIAYKKSVTAFFTNNKKSAIVRRVKDDLSKLGKVVELPEKHFDLFTAIFGSGPAFLLTILQVLKNKITELNIADSKIDELLIELVTGTVTFLQENHKRTNIEDLIKKVASKGGVTEAGLNYFKSNNLDKFFGDVIVTAQKKSKDMEK